MAKYDWDGDLPILCSQKKSKVFTSSTNIFNINSEFFHGAEEEMWKPTWIDSLFKFF